MANLDSWFSVNQKYAERKVDTKQAFELAALGKTNAEIAKETGFTLAAFKTRYTKSLSLREAIQNGRKIWNEKLKKEG